MRNYAKTALAVVTGILSSVSVCRTGSVVTRQERPLWTELAGDVTATVYNATPTQCNGDFLHTASMYEIDKSRIEDIRVIAMERTMMKKFGLTYGMVVKIEGTDSYDGLWRIEDTMNKRFAGQHKIDILVPDHIRRGKWENVKISVPANGMARRLCDELLNKKNI